LFLSEKGTKAAKAFIQDLTDKLFSLAASGVTGSPRDLISPGLRGFPYRKRYFYFRIVEDKMIVVRVLHGSQDTIEQEFP
jgi:toxin ParE1/3/4